MSDDNHKTFGTLSDAAEAGVFDRLMNTGIKAIGDKAGGSGGNGDVYERNPYTGGKTLIYSQGRAVMPKHETQEEMFRRVIKAELDKRGIK